MGLNMHLRLMLCFFRQLICSIFVSHYRMHDWFKYSCQEKWKARPVMELNMHLRLMSWFFRQLVCSISVCHYKMQDWVNDSCRKRWKAGPVCHGVEHASQANVVVFS